MPSMPIECSGAAIKRREVFALVAILSIDVAGIMFAHRHLAELRKEANLAKEGIGSLIAGVDPMAGLASEEGHAAPAASEAVEVRTQSLKQLTDLMKKGLISAASASQIALVSPDGSGRKTPPYAFDFDGMLSPNFGDFFALNGKEVAKLQETILSMKKRVEELVAAETVVVKLGEDSYRIENAPIDESDALREEFLGIFRATLGEDRFRAFMALNGEREPPPSGVSADLMAQFGVFQWTGPAAFFEAFGGVKRTITISKVNGLYYMDLKSVNGSMRTNGVPTLDTNNRLRLGNALKLLPKDF